MSILERVSIGSLAQGAAPPGYTFTRSTTATYIDSDGLLKVAAINTPRRQWDSANRRWGYVGEPGRTNLLLYSKDLTNAAWQKRGTAAVTTDGTKWLDGSDASLITGLDTLANDVYQQLAGISSGTAYAAAFWIKRVTTAGVLLCMNPSNQAQGEWRIDLSLLPDSWERVTASHPAVTVIAATTGSASNGGGIHFRKLSGTGTQSFYIGNCQAEVGAYSSSDIPTTTVSVSRGADLLTRALTAGEGTALSAQGTMVVEFSFLGGGSAVLTGDRALATLDGGSYASSMNIYNRSGAVGVNAGNGTFGQAGAAVAVSQRAKCAFAWSSARVNFALDGTLQGAADTTVTIPAVTSLTFGASAYFGALNGLIYGWTIYDDAKTDAELQALTTPTTNRNQSRLTLGLGLGL